VSPRRVGGAKRSPQQGRVRTGRPPAAPVAPDKQQPTTTGPDETDEAPALDPEILAASPDDDLPVEAPELPEGSGALAVAPRALAESGLPAPYDPLARYIHEIRRFPPVSRDEELQLARRHRDQKDPEATKRLITAHLMLVVKLALMYRRAIRNVMDLIQEGNIGLLEALKRYDPEQGVRFPTYAAWWIKAYMLKFLLDNARMVRVGTTNARRKLLYNLRRERDRLIQQGIAPTPKLLAERFGVPETDVVEVEEAITGRDISVDAPVREDGSATVGDVMATPGPSVEDAVGREEVRERIAAAMQEFRTTLGERDQLLLDLRLTADEPATLQEIGDRFGVTREAVRQTENRLKERLAQFLRQRLGEEIILRFTGRR
jgi:RNA polymerase sigma-32 factor